MVQLHLTLTLNAYKTYIRRTIEETHYYNECVLNLRDCDISFWSLHNNKNDIINNWMSGITCTPSVTQVVTFIMMTLKCCNFFLLFIIHTRMYPYYMLYVLGFFVLFWLIFISLEWWKIYSVQFCKIIELLYRRWHIIESRKSTETWDPIQNFIQKKCMLFGGGESGLMFVRAAQFRFGSRGLYFWERGFIWNNWIETSSKYKYASTSSRWVKKYIYIQVYFLMCEHLYWRVW